MDWLWQNLLSNVVWVILALVGSIVLAGLKRRLSAWSEPILYGFGAFFLLLGIGVLIQVGRNASSHAAIRVGNTSNVEPVIRKWLDAFHFSVSTEPDSESEFALLVTLSNGNKMAVRRLTALREYITLQALVTLPPDQTTLLKRLSKQEQNIVRSEVVMNTASQKIGFTVKGIPIESVDLSRRILITPELSEEEFLRGFDDLDTAVLVVQESITLGIEKQATHAKN